MKNSKRDITLNEKDSLRDMLCAEKNLLMACFNGLFFAERKEIRTYLSVSMKMITEDIFLLIDLIKKDSEGMGKKE